MRVGRLHRGVGAAEDAPHAADSVADGLARRGDEVLGGLDRLERRPPRRLDCGLAAIDLFELGRGRHLPRAHAQQVRPLDDERSPFGVELKGVLEVVEADGAADPVIRALRQLGRQRLARRQGRRRLVLAGLQGSSGSAEEEPDGQRRGACPPCGEPMNCSQLSSPMLTQPHLPAAGRTLALKPGGEKTALFARAGAKTAERGVG